MSEAKRGSACSGESCGARELGPPARAVLMLPPRAAAQWRQWQQQASSPQRGALPLPVELTGQGGWTECPAGARHSQLPCELCSAVPGGRASSCLCVPGAGSCSRGGNRSLSLPLQSHADDGLRSLCNHETLAHPATGTWLSGDESRNWNVRTGAAQTCGQPYSRVHGTFPWASSTVKADGWTVKPVLSRRPICT